MMQNRQQRQPSPEDSGASEPDTDLAAERHTRVRGLPRFLTSFIGRNAMIQSITALLMREDVRMLTLTGPGGSGKTRLAVEVVGRLPPGTWEDTWFIPLASVHDPKLVVPDIAQTIGVRHVSGRPVVDTLVRFLGGRHALLVIDNFETVVAAGSELTRILNACPGVTLLLTSRVALQVSGEHIVTVPPMELPGVSPLPLERLRSLESVRLFEERARASSSAFAITEENAPDIVAICRRLDGLPLALELAAARCGMLSPAALFRILTQQRGILSGGPRDAPERHRSMRNAIAWSYDLLSEHEQAVFRNLAVFSGGFTLEAAEAVTTVGGDLLETLASLTAKSLIVPLPSDDAEARFTMLETLREYGLERLDEAGEMAPARDRHAAFYLNEAIQGEYAWCMFLPEGVAWLSRLVADHANFREALTWLNDSGDVRSCLRMSGALGSLWAVCGDLNEGRSWLERLLADGRVIDRAVRATGLATLSWISNEQDRTDMAFELAEEVIALSQESGILLDAIRGHLLSGVAAPDLNQCDLATHRLEAAITLMRTPGLPDWISNFLHNAMVMLGYVELRCGNVRAAETWINDAYDYDLARGYEPGTSYIMGGVVFTGLIWVTRVHGKAHLALQYARQCLLRNTGYPYINSSIHTICDTAGVLSMLGQYIPAARLFGASEALMEAYGYDFSEAFNFERAAGLPEPWAREDETCGMWEALRLALRPRTVPSIPTSITLDALDTSWAEGRMLSLDAAVAEALVATSEATTNARPDSDQHLTPRQMDVLRLVVDGLSNRAIAETLSLSERTVEHHIMHILDRLGVESRTAAATYAVRARLF